jgi:TPR repeat protein
MNKVIKTLTAVLFTASFSSFATSTDGLVELDEYTEQISQALELYQSSDYKSALPELELSAMRGDKTAQYIVGTMYLNGQGTNQDLLKSYAWLTVANEQKTKHWKKPLKMLNSKLPADFLKHASVEAEKFVDLYGVKTQQLKCRNTKTLGSKKGTHLCTKSEIKPGYVFVANPTYLVSQ